MQSVSYLFHFLYSCFLWVHYSSLTYHSYPYFLKLSFKPACVLRQPCVVVHLIFFLDIYLSIYNNIYINTIPWWDSYCGPRFTCPNNYSYICGSFALAWVYKVWSSNFFDLLFLGLLNLLVSTNFMFSSVTFVLIVFYFPYFNFYFSSN